MTIELQKGNISTRGAFPDSVPEKRAISGLLAALEKIGAPDDGVQKRPSSEAPKRRGG